MTNLLFLIIGNFITCSYARNFTVFDLLRQPLVFNGWKQERFFVFNVPKGLPIGETIFIADDLFSSKLKDLAIKKEVKEKDKNNNFIILDSLALEDSIVFDQSVRFKSYALVYSPWYRFVSEPFSIGEITLFSDHILGTFSYALRSQGIDSTLIKSNESESLLNLSSEYNGFDKIVLRHSSGIESIRLEGNNIYSELSLSEKEISFRNSHDFLLFSVLSKIE